MNNDIHERKIRHIMCTLMTLKIMVILLAMEFMSFDKADMTETIKLAYFHEYSLFEILLFFFIFAVPVTCTILSARFQTFYCLYESLHCLLGVIILFYSFSSPLMIIPGIIICFILSIRFIIYIMTVKNC